MNGLTGGAANLIDDAETAVRAAGSATHRPSFKQTWELIRSDLEFRCVYENKAPGALLFVKLMRHPGVACVIRFRLQHYCYARGLRPLGWLLKFMNVIFYGVEISEHARIGPGLLIIHANTIIIDANASIGERCVLYHQNSITKSPFYGSGEDPGPISVGDDVVFGGGSCAYGHIHIGDRTAVGTNSVVNRSFPAGSSLFGVPARLIGKSAGD